MLVLELCSISGEIHAHLLKQLGWAYEEIIKIVQISCCGDNLIGTLYKNTLILDIEHGRDDQQYANNKNTWHSIDFDFGVISIFWMWEYLCSLVFFSFRRSTGILSLVLEYLRLCFVLSRSMEFSVYESNKEIKVLQIRLNVTVSLMINDALHEWIIIGDGFEDRDDDCAQC